MEPTTPAASSPDRHDGGGGAQSGRVHSTPTAADRVDHAPNTGEDGVQRRRNKQILAAARASLDVVGTTIRNNYNVPGFRHLVDHVLHHPGVPPPPELQPYIRLAQHLGIHNLRATLADSVIYQLWSRTKVVYAMDELLLPFFAEAATSRVPTAVLRGLPHPNPYLLLPAPDHSDPLTTYFRTHIGIPAGAFVFGRYHHGQFPCSTADHRREDLGLMFAGILEGAEGPTTTFLRCTIPLRGDTFTVEDAIRTTIDQFNFTGDLAETDPSKLETWLRIYVAQAFNSILYTCTDQPDIQTYAPGAPTARAAKRRQRHRLRPGDVNEIVKLGFRMGPALHAAQRRWEQQPPTTGGDSSSRGQQRPHRKRSHLRTYWTGPGRTTPVTKWIKPFWVNEHLLYTADEPSTVLVRPLRPRP